MQARPKQKPADEEFRTRDTRKRHKQLNCWDLHSLTVQLIASKTFGISSTKEKERSIIKKKTKTKKKPVVRHTCVLLTRLLLTVYLHPSPFASISRWNWTLEHKKFKFMATTFMSRYGSFAAVSNNISNIDRFCVHNCLCVISRTSFLFRLIRINWTSSSLSIFRCHNWMLFLLIMLLHLQQQYNVHDKIATPI